MVIQNFRLGIVARTDNSGLGVMTFDFFRNFIVEKVLTISGAYENYLDRFEGYEGTKQIVCRQHTPTLEEIDEFLEDLDVVVAFETPYNWNLFKKAKEKGIKTVLIPMYEWLPEKDKIPFEPDLYLCPSELDFKVIEGNKELIHTPINLDLIPYKEREEAKTFIFNNGHGGYGGRNSLSEFLEAIQFVKSDVKFLIRSQVEFEGINDSRVTVIGGDLAYEDLWKDGDICVHIHKFDGLSLPLNEAMAAGMPVIGLNTYPQNSFLPCELLIEPEAIGKKQLARQIDCAVVSPLRIAEMIDKVAQMPSDKIKELSKKSREIAEGWSWNNQKGKFITAIQNLCNKNEQ